MEAVEFPEQNTVYAKNQSEYRPLPALNLGDRSGEVITCWKLSFGERLRLLFSGKLWVSMLTFNKPLTPIYITVDKDDVI